MDIHRAFFDGLRVQILRKSVNNGNVHNCRMWTGCVNGKYGRKRVKYPDGTTKLEYVARLMYMCKTLDRYIPPYDADGSALDVSHLCGHSLCVNEDHLTLETHSVNMERVHCQSQHVCTGAHYPLCMI